MSNNPKQPTVTTKEVVQSAFSSKALTQDQMNILRTQIAPDISDNDLMYCLEIADNRKLNPILKDIYFVPRMAQINSRWVTKHEPMVGRKGARSIARRKGMKVPPNTGHTIKKFPVLKNGEWTEERDLIGWAELTINGQIVTKEAAYSVYKQTKKDGSVTKFWKDMPTVMVEKVAEFQLLDAVYGLNGVMSVDAGILTDDEPVNTSINSANKEDMAKALETFGLSYKVEDGLMKVEGSTFQHSKSLKQLGFNMFNNQWQIRVNDEPIDVETTQPTNTNAPKELFQFLTDNGLNKADAGKFVKEGLGLTSADLDGCAVVLQNKEKLLADAHEFLLPVINADEVPDF